MNAVRSIISNTAARTFTEILNRLGSAVFWILIARKLGVSGLGSIAFAMSLFALFSSISTLGLGTVVIRDVARDRDRAGQYFGQLLKLGLLLSVLFAALMIVVVFIIHPNPDSSYAAMAMAFALIPASGFYWSKSILSAAEKMGYIAVARTAENVFKVGIGLVLLMSGAGIREMVLVFMLSKVVSFVICYSYAVDRIAQPVWHTDFSLFRYLLKQAPSFSLITVFNGLFWSLAVIMLTAIKGEAEAGLFSAAFKLVELCIAVSLAYGQAFFPVVSRFAYKDEKMFVNLSKKSIKYITMVTIAVAAGTTVMAPQIITLIYGANMTAAVPVLRISIWLVIPFGVIPVLAYSLISRNMQKLDLLANIAAAGVVLIANLVLLHFMGTPGTAVAMLLAGLVFFAVEFYWVTKKLYKMTISLQSLNPVMGAIIMSFAVFLLKDTLIFIPIITGALLYILYLWISRTLTQMDINYLRQLGSVR